MKQQEMQDTWAEGSNGILCYELGDFYKEADLIRITVSDPRYGINSKRVECSLRLESPDVMEITVSPNCIRGEFDQALTDKQSEHFGLASSIKALKDIQERIAENIAILEQDERTYTDVQAYKLLQPTPTCQ